MPGIQSGRFGLPSVEDSVLELTAPLVTGSLLPVAGMQALWLMHRVGFLPEPEGPSQGLHPGGGPALRVLFVGDSSVVGVGVDHTDQAVGASFARIWSAKTGRAVHWRLCGEYGATTGGITARVVPQIASEPVDLIVVSTGTNDIMKRTPAARFAQDLRSLVQQVRARVGHAPAVVCQLPPMWSFPVLPQPLRSWAAVRRELLGRHQRRVVAGLRDGVMFSGVERVDASLFAGDGFHPCADGYRHWAEQLCELWADRGVSPLPLGG